MKPGMQRPPDRQSRRTFLKRSSATLAALGSAPVLARASTLGRSGRTPPSDRITIGIIGTGNQGTADMGRFLADERVQVVAVCDVNRSSAGYWDGAVAGREPARRIVESHYAAESGLPYKGCAEYEDFRELLQREDIDAVEVATPDHWHAIQVIEAARAKKDIYCQKPLSLTVSEGRAMTRAVRKHERVFQTGSQQRSDWKFRHACELVRNGRIGTVQRVRCGLPGGWPDFGRTADRKEPETVPDGFNYDLWLGPAPYAPYAPARCHVNFRWILDYSGGQVTDWGGHHPDIVHWALGAEQTGPTLIRNAGGVFPEDPLYNTATAYYFECVYENGVTLEISNEYENGIRFEGSTGWVFVNRSRIETFPVRLESEEFGAGDTRLYASDDHFRNFIDCVLSREETVAPCENAHRSISLCHLGNIAMLLGRDIRWDPVREQVIGDPAAQWMLNRPYREPWQLESA